MVEGVFGDLVPAVDPVHDLQRAIRSIVPLPGTGLEAVHERGRLLGEAQPQQRVHRERRIPHPGVAVVPVALSADDLRQCRGRRRDDRSGRRVGEQLEHERRAVNHLAPPPAVAGRREPAAPERQGVLERRGGLLGLDGGVAAMAARDALEDEGRRLAGREREIREHAVLAALQPERRGQ